MRARRMTEHVDPARIGAETPGVGKNPGDCAADLVRDRHQVAARIEHAVEVEHREVRAGTHKRLGRKRIVFGLALTPRAAMHKHAHRRTSGVRGKEIEAFDRLFAVGKPLRLAEHAARERAR